MKYDPVLAALRSQPWSNGACRGYVIYAMEACGFSHEDIRRVVSEFHNVFDLCGLEDAEAHYQHSLYSFETLCPKVRPDQRAATARVPPFGVSPQDKGKTADIDAFDYGGRST